MEISRWGLRRALQNVTDNYYETVKDTEAKGLTKKQYFDLSLYLIDENFILRPSADRFSFRFDNDDETTLKFLRYFIVFCRDSDLQFRINYEFGTTNIILFNDHINENKLIEIMMLLFCECKSMLTDYLSQIKGGN